MLEVTFISSIFELDAKQWNAIAGVDYPFGRYEFLQALETSKAVSPEMGWSPQHCLVYSGAKLVAIMPSYIKTHSFGEYVFDAQWAEAYRRNGLHYYPKLISAIPYTPVTDARIFLLAGEDKASIYAAISDAVHQLAQHKGLSGWHVLFLEKNQSDALNPLNTHVREAIHFQWNNHNFSNFDDFLATFSSRKRKNLRKERKKVCDQGITFHTFTGDDIDENLWQDFYAFYQITYAKRSGHGGYLNKAFFQMVGNTMAENIVLIMAEYKGRYVAGALNFKSNDCLYGRYWGALENFDSLHFETCYYQGIEYCIKHQLTRFDPGVQGEHKIQRGFEPTYTYSNHWLKNTQFADAVKHFLDEESVYIQGYKEQTDKLLPFKK